MVADARKEIEAARQAAYQQGLETAQRESAAALQAAHAIVEETATWKEALVDQSVPLIVDMVTEIARKMFGEGVALSDQALQQNLNRVLTSGKSLGDLNIYLNPQDAATLDSGWREMRSMTTGSRVRILPADDIKRGGCYIQGQMGAIDARVETQLKTVLDTFEAEPSNEELNQ
jgi:flagellar assembly protein FliH